MPINVIVELSTWMYGSIADLLQAREPPLLGIYWTLHALHSLQDSLSD